MRCLLREVDARAQRNTWEISFKEKNVKWHVNFLRVCSPMVDIIKLVMMNLAVFVIVRYLQQLMQLVRSKPIISSIYLDTQIKVKSFAVQFHHMIFLLHNNYPKHLYSNFRYQVYEYFFGKVTTNIKTRVRQKKGNVNFRAITDNDLLFLCRSTRQRQTNCKIRNLKF